MRAEMTLIAVATTALPGLVVGSVLVDGSALVLDCALDDADVLDSEALEVVEALEVSDALVDGCADDVSVAVP